MNSLHNPARDDASRAAREREEAEEFAAHRHEVRQHPAVESAKSTRWSIAVSNPGPHPRHRGLKPAPPGAAPATEEQDARKRRRRNAVLIGDGVAHTSAFEPAPEETGTAASYGRDPEDRGRSTTNHPTQTDRWHLPGRNWAATGAESDGGIVTGKLRFRGSFLADTT